MEQAHASAAGVLRWIRPANRTPSLLLLWHLAFDAQHPLCGQLFREVEERRLGVQAPDDRCPRCLAIMRSYIGL